MKLYIPWLVRMTIIFAIVCLAYAITKDSTDFKLTIKLLFIGLLPLVITFLMDFAFSSVATTGFQAIWRVIAFFISILIVMFSLISTVESCDYVCGYPVYFITLGNYVFMGLSFISIGIIESRKKYNN